MESGASLLARVTRLVHTDLLRRWTVTEVARALGLSSRSLQRGLAAEGTAFSRLVDQARVEQACTMLRDPARSLTEVGYLCGFADSAHFSSRFRAHTGSTPSEWRKKHAEGR